MSLSEMTDFKELSKNKVFAGTVAKYSFKVSIEAPGRIRYSSLASIHGIVICTGRLDCQLQPLPACKCQLRDKGAPTYVSGRTDVHRRQRVSLKSCPLGLFLDNETHNSQEHRKAASSRMLHLKASLSYSPIHRPEVQA